MNNDDNDNNGNLVKYRLYYVVKVVIKESISDTYCTERIKLKTLVRKSRVKQF